MDDNSEHFAIMKVAFGFFSSCNVQAAERPCTRVCCRLHILVAPFSDAAKVIGAQGQTSVSKQAGKGAMIFEDQAERV